MHPALSASSPMGNYFNLGVIHISYTNLAIILVMVVLFVLALVVPFPHGTDITSAPVRQRADEDEEGRP